MVLTLLACPWRSAAGTMDPMMMDYVNHGMSKYKYLYVLPQIALQKCLYSALYTLAMPLTAVYMVNVSPHIRTKYKE